MRAFCFMVRLCLQPLKNDLLSQVQIGNSQRDRFFAWYILHEIADIVAGGVIVGVEGIHEFTVRRDVSCACLHAFDQFRRGQKSLTRQAHDLRFTNRWMISAKQFFTAVFVRLKDTEVIVLSGGRVIAGIPHLHTNMADRVMGNAVFLDDLNDRSLMIFKIDISVTISRMTASRYRFSPDTAASVCSSSFVSISSKGSGADD